VFRLSTHPAAITVTQGIGDGFNYLGASWRRWLPVVVVVAACTFVLYAIFGSTDTTNLVYTDPYTNEVTWSPDTSSRISAAVAVGLSTGLVTLIGSWVFYATAIAGLRSKPLTVSDIVVRGLLTVAAGIVMAVVAIAAVVVWAVVTVIVPAVGILLFFVAMPFAIYLAIRLVFVSMAIFDGFGPIEGIKESWRLSRGSATRLFGWGLMAGLITIGFAIAGGIVSAPFTVSKAQPVGQAFSTAVTTIGSCFSIFMMAVLYESERARKDPATYGYGPGMAYPWPNPTWPGGGPYAAGPYAPGAYPPGPSAAGPYPGGPLYAPGSYPVGPYGAGPYPGGPSTPAPYPVGPYGAGPYPAASNPYAPGPSSAGPVWPGAPATPSSAPPDQGAGGLPYGGVTPGYPGGQPPRWEPSSTAPAGPGYQAAPPAWGPNPDATPAMQPEEPGATPPQAPEPTDPPPGT
jgi:hypothetical protein